MMSERYERAKIRMVAWLDRRKRSYFTLVPKLLRKDKTLLPMDIMAMADLARFCRAAPGTVLGKTDRDTYILIGRQQVFGRLAEHLSLSPADLFKLYTTERTPTTEDD